MAFPEKRTERKKSTEAPQGFVVVARRVGVVTEKIVTRFLAGKFKGTIPPVEGVGRDLGVWTSEQKGSPRGETLGRVEMLPLNKKNRRNIVGNGLGEKICPPSPSQLWFVGGRRISARESAEKKFFWVGKIFGALVTCTSHAGGVG